MAPSARDFRAPAGRRLFVTGGAGFIGSHLVEHALALGYQVSVLDDLSMGRMDNLAAARRRPGFRFVNGSVLDEHLVREMVQESDAVVHLAAVLGVMRVLREPVDSIEANVGGADVVLRAAAAYRKPLLLASSSEVYGNRTEVPFRETDDLRVGVPTATRWGYAASKIMAECLAMSYAGQHGLPVTVVRFFSVVGPRQRPEGGFVIPQMVARALTKGEVTVYGDGRQSRCFIHVADAVRAVLLLIACEEARGRIVNVGTTEEVTISELAATVLAEVGLRADAVRYEPYEAGYAKGFEAVLRRVPDVTLLARLTGFGPEYRIRDVVRETVAYQRERLAVEVSANGRRTRKVGQARRTPVQRLAGARGAAASAAGGG